MNLNVNRVNIPQANYNNSKQIAFGEKSGDGATIERLQDRVGKLEEKSKLYRQFVATTIDQLHTLSKPIGKADSPDMQQLGRIHERLIELDRLA